MSNLSVFTFECQEVRFVGTADKPEWIASDVGKVLEIKNVRQLLAKFSEDEKGVCNMILLTNLTKERSKLIKSFGGLTYLQHSKLQY